MKFANACYDTVLSGEYGFRDNLSGHKEGRWR